MSKTPLMTAHSFYFYFFAILTPLAEGEGQLQQ
jgi:hypothetical protein